MKNVIKLKLAALLKKAQTIKFKNITEYEFLIHLILNYYSEILKLRSIFLNKMSKIRKHA